MAAGQAEDAVAGAEAELGIGVALQDRRDEGEDVGADLARVPLEAGAGVLDAGALVRPRLMLLARGGAALVRAPQMAGDLPAAVEDVDHLAAQADVDLLADVGVGHRVEVPLDGDVVVGVDPVLAPERALPAPLRQRPHMGKVDGLEALVAALAGAVGIGPGVELPDPGGDRPVERRQVVEDLLAQRRQDPAFDMEHALLHRTLVAWPPDPRREALDPVMVEQVGIRLVQDRLGARRCLHRRLEVVRHYHLGRPPHRLEAAHVRGAPVVNLLGQRRLGVEPARHPHRGDEHLRLALLAVDHERHGHAGVIDEQLLAGTAVLAHRHVAPRAPLAEPAAPGRIAHAVGMRLAPLLPQQHQRHAATRQRLFDRRPVHHRTRGVARPAVERPLQRLVVQRAGLRPAQARGRKPRQRLRHRAPRETAVERDRPGAAALVKMVRKDLPHLPHRKPSPCHPCPPGSSKTRGVGRQPVRRINTRRTQGCPRR